MAWSEGENGVLKEFPSLKIESYYQSSSLHRPINSGIIAWLLEYQLYDAQYGPEQNGLRGLYQAQLDHFLDGDAINDERPILYMLIAQIGTVPVGVCTLRRVRGHKGVDHIVDLFVAPEHRRKGYGGQLLRRMWQFGAPAMAMRETESVMALLRKYPTISPLRKPTELDRAYAAAVRTLDTKDRWTNQDGSVLCTVSILETLHGQRKLIEELRKQINPHDGSYQLPEGAGNGG